MFGRVADASLVAAIVIAPVAGGSVSRLMLPVLAVLVLVSFLASVAAVYSSERRQHLSSLPIAMVAFACFTLLQAVPIPAGLLSIVSPRAHEVRELVGALETSTISYEPLATIREASLLFMYAMLAQVAYERASSRRGFTFVADAVVIAGVASVAIAALHRLFEVEDMLFVLPSARPASRLVTTFVNPNHGAGFMLLVALVALGQSVAARRRSERAKYLGAALLCASASALCLSRGGLIALVAGFGAFAFLALRKTAGDDEARSSVPALIGATVAVPIAGLVWRYTDLLRELFGSDGSLLGIDAKLAAAKDAWPLILEHPIFGIGRGAYGSVYPSYKTAPHQLTYTHPENVIVQLASDWGALIGAIAIVLLVLAVVTRARRARSRAILGAMIGVLALLLHNLADFSLEVPGVAIPAAVLLGAAGVGVVREHRVGLASERGIALVAFPVCFLLGTSGLALSDRDLSSDLEVLGKAAWREGRPEIGRLEPIAAKHPANPIVAARMAYVAETASEPDIPAALRWANRTLFLAPTYSDGHLVAGRLLATLGHRRQAFEEMRLAWSLSDGRHREEIIRQIIRLARSPDELLRAVPRRDAVMDVPDEAHVARGVRLVLGRRKTPKRMAWAKALLGVVTDEGSVRATDLVRVAGAAIAAEEYDLAERLLAKQRAIDPLDGRALALTLEILRSRKDVAGIERVMAEARDRPGLDPLPFARARLHLEMEAGRWEAAAEALEEVRRRLPPTLPNQIYVARTQAQIALEDHRPAAAASALDAAIRLAPHDVELRLQRAQVYLELGKVDRARLDVAAVLKIAPGHGAAQRLSDRLSGGSPPPTGGR